MVKGLAEGVRVRGWCALVLGVFVTAEAARADIVSFTESVPLTATNWSESLSFPRFDSALGMLDQVDVVLSVTMDGTIRFESLDAAPTTIATSLSAEVALRRPDGSTLVVLTPEHVGLDAVSSFDGLIDFDGGSGRTVSVSESSSSSVAFEDAGDLAVFIGSGAIQLPIQAEAESSAGGAGGLLAMISSSASADATVRYHFTAVPAPPAVLMGVMGMGLIGWVRRRM